MEQLATYAAPIATTIAALIVASNLGSRMTGIGFIIFTIGSVAWALLGAVTHQPNLLWQNILLTALNLFGIWRWLGRQARIEDGAATAAKASETQPSETLFPVSMLTRSPVVSREGEDLGHCVDAMAGCTTGRLSYVVVSEGGVAGVGETLRRLPWVRCSADDQQVRAEIDKAQFEQLEQVEPDRWPAR